MTDPPQTSSAALRASILEQARTTADDLLRRAREEAEALTSDAEAGDRARHESRKREARAEAGRRVERIRAATTAERDRMVATRIEALLDDVRHELTRAAVSREDVDERASLIELAVQAVRQMEGEAFVLVVAAADHAVLDAPALDAIRTRAARPGATFAIETSAALTCGLVIRDVEVRQEWDNRREARLVRLWPALRRHIAAAAGFLEARHA